ncbi:MAG: hypothetical protein JSV17_12475 [Candidatus Aminicenantes bacterium]|nr:MAG: hypothetical protein JSV17_12475 [Candidatus Aminicenantes bacterium]
MRKYDIIFNGIVVVLVVFGLIGCKEAIDENSFIGTWVNTTTEGKSWKSFSLHGDGKAELIYWNNNTAGPCTWKISDEKLIVTDNAEKILIDLRYKFRSKTKLVLSGTPENIVMSGDGIYIKQ